MGLDDGMWVQWEGILEIISWSRLCSDGSLCFLVGAHGAPATTRATSYSNCSSFPTTMDRNLSQTMSQNK